MVRNRIKMSRAVPFVRVEYAKQHAQELRLRGYKVRRVGNKVYSSIEKVRK